MCTGTEVALVGGGNSAGQAAVFLSQHVSRLHMLVRSSGLATSMSQYLIDRIDATPTIELRTHTRLTQLEGDPGGHLEAIPGRHVQKHHDERRPARDVVLFVGADPATE